MLKVVIEPQRLSVALKSKPDEPIVEGDLFEKIKVDETFWTIEDSQYLQITF